MIKIHLNLPFLFPKAENAKKHNLRVCEICYLWKGLCFLKLFRFWGWLNRVNITKGSIMIDGTDGWSTNIKSGIVPW